MSTTGLQITFRVNESPQVGSTTHHMLGSLVDFPILDTESISKSTIFSHGGGGGTLASQLLMPSPNLTKTQISYVHCMGRQLLMLRLSPNLPKTQTPCVRRGCRSTSQSLLLSPYLPETHISYVQARGDSLTYQLLMPIPHLPETQIRYVQWWGRGQMTSQLLMLRLSPNLPKT